MPIFWTKEVEDGIWVVSFLNYDLGYFDEEGKRVEPVADLFGTKVLPMCPEWTIPRMVSHFGFNE